MSSGLSRVVTMKTQVEKWALGIPLWYDYNYITYFYEKSFHLISSS